MHLLVHVKGLNVEHQLGIDRVEDAKRQQHVPADAIDGRKPAPAAKLPSSDNVVANAFAFFAVGEQVEVAISLGFKDGIEIADKGRVALEQTTIQRVERKTGN